MFEYVPLTSYTAWVLRNRDHVSTLAKGYRIKNHSESTCPICLEGASILKRTIAESPNVPAFESAGNRKKKFSEPGHLRSL